MVNDTWADYEHLAALSDEELCACVRAGNRLAEEVLAARYHRLVRSCARPYFLAGGDSEDLLQEGIDKGQWVVSQPSDAMKAELKEIYEQIWEESKNEYPAEIMDAIISGSYKN